MTNPAEEQSTQRTWLESLQQESWQLELIVSGVVIFLLLGAYSPMVEFGDTLSRYQNGDSELAMPVLVAITFLLLSYFALVTMFLIHLFLRGLWIGAIGLRSISGGFDLQTLGYQPKYEHFLRGHLGKFDDYLQRLEKHASLAFSLAFLLFFAILGFGLAFSAIIVTTSVLNFVVSEIFGPNGTQNARYVIAAVIIPVLLVYMLFGLLYLIDFLTFGWVKRRKLIRRIYYPFYRFFGWVTLARFYRPLYYNLIDNPFGRRLIRRYLLATFIICVVTMFNFHPYLYFPFEAQEGVSLNLRYYLDQVEEDKYPRQSVSLGSRFAREDYLEVFVPYDLPGSFGRRYPDLNPIVDYALTFLNEDWYFNDSLNYDTLLAAQTSMYQLQLNDSVLLQPQWYFYEHPLRKQPGYLYDLPVYDLPRGSHTLHINRLYVSDANEEWRPWESIPFVR